MYRTTNLFAPSRYTWFSADAPHLMKPARNCLYHSGDQNHHSRHLWNDGREIVWKHLVRIAEDNLKRGTKTIQKLAMDHVYLNSYSVMSVNLATQALSQSTANVLRKYYSTDTNGTSELCEKFDQLFDCLNTRHLKEGERKRRPFLMPYRSIDDNRFDWLRREFLGYLFQWKPGNFTRNDKTKMFLSAQTYEGLQITVNSLIEVVKFFLFMSFVFSERFNQDVLEEYFGRHRCLGRRNDNPTVYQFCYQSNTIKDQRSVAPVTGNTKGGHQKKPQVSWYEVDDRPLPKIYISHANTYII